MKENLLIDDRGLERARGQYVVFDDCGDLVSQNDDFDRAMNEAKAKGVKNPAVVDLELAEDRFYVF
jgi:hypothetical protein